MHGYEGTMKKKKKKGKEKYQVGRKRRSRGEHLPQVKHNEWRKKEKKEGKRIRAENHLPKPPHKNIMK